ncbi:MAG TPA: SIS domain-containing protein [Methylomirabilota bacterium]|jgi:glucosamine--fructose-6-phosphate aminotransferase (isomerizing)|nr:SIS domain-containing protein [Methylomirabilota bacterium]
MTASPPPRAAHPYYTHDAIYAQPGALRLVDRGNEAALATAAAALRGAARVWLTGVGSSWHVAMFGEHALAVLGRLGARARAVVASEWTAYGPHPDAGDAVVAITHRGSRAAADALALATSRGAVTIAVTGKGVTLEAAHALRTVDAEASDAHTISYTAALALLALLAAETGADAAARAGIGALPDLIAFLLGQESWDDLGARYAARRRWWLLGGGPNAATAREGALKLTETAWLVAAGLEPEQFLHGPCAALEAEDVLVLVTPPGPARARALDAARLARRAGAAVLALAREDDADVAAVATETIALPEVDEALSPIPAVVPLQLLAYHVALALGRNPDRLRRAS